MVRHGMRLVFWMAALLLCTACAAKVVPQPTATARLDPVDGSLTEVQDGVAVSVRVDQLAVQPYQLVDNLASFHVMLDNRTDRPVTFPLEAFVVRDGQGRQYRAISPEKVREIVSRDTVYLIPYPYVGYYYLEDQQRGAFTQTMASSLPFYAEYHPQDLFTRALPAGPVLPVSKAAGVVYFTVDPLRVGRVELLVFPDAELSGEPRYRFPFAVEK